ncbi:unnamed protein product, partial [Prorocentrum cordatum]
MIESVAGWITNNIKASACDIPLKDLEMVVTFARDSATIQEMFQLTADQISNNIKAPEYDIPLKDLKMAVVFASNSTTIQEGLKRAAEWIPDNIKASVSDIPLEGLKMVVAFASNSARIQEMFESTAEWIANSIMASVAGNSTATQEMFRLVAEWTPNCIKAPLHNIPLNDIKASVVAAGNSTTIQEGLKRAAEWIPDSIKASVSNVPLKDFKMALAFASNSARIQEMFESMAEWIPNSIKAAVAGTAAAIQAPLYNIPLNNIKASEYDLTLKDLKMAVVSAAGNFTTIQEGLKCVTEWTPDSIKASVSDIPLKDLKMAVAFASNSARTQERFESMAEWIPNSIKASVAGNSTAIQEMSWLVAERAPNSIKEDFPRKDRILGERRRNADHAQRETGAKLRLTGKGTGDSDAPLTLSNAASGAVGDTEFDKAVELREDLLEPIYEEAAGWAGADEDAEPGKGAKGKGKSKKGKSDGKGKDKGKEKGKGKRLVVEWTPNGIKASLYNTPLKGVKMASADDDSTATQASVCDIPLKELDVVVASASNSTTIQEMFELVADQTPNNIKASEHNIPLKDPGMAVALASTSTTTQETFRLAADQVPNNIKAFEYNFPLKDPDIVVALVSNSTTIQEMFELVANQVPNNIKASVYNIPLQDLKMAAVDDDSTATQVMAQVAASWRRWSAALGLKENRSKEQFGHRTKAGRRQLRAQAGFTEATVLAQPLLLGRHFQPSQRRRKAPKEEARLAAAQARMRRLAIIPRSGLAKRRFAAGTMAVALRGWVARPPNQADVDRLGAAARRALRAARRGSPHLFEMLVGHSASASHRMMEAPVAAAARRALKTRVPPEKGWRWTRPGTGGAVSLRPEDAVSVSKLKHDLREGWRAHRFAQWRRSTRNDAEFCRGAVQCDSLRLKEAQKHLQRQPAILPVLTGAAMSCAAWQSARREEIACPACGLEGGGHLIHLAWDCPGASGAAHRRRPPRPADPMQARLGWPIREDPGYSINVLDWHLQ